MRFVLLLMGALLSFTLSAQSSFRYDTLSRSYLTYASGRLVEREQIENFISHKSTTTYYYPGGAKKMEYSIDYKNVSVFVDTLYEWSTNGNIKYMEIYSDSGHLELSFDTIIGTILARGEYIYGSYDTMIYIPLRDFSGYQSSWCREGCMYPVGHWTYYYSNGLMQSEGSYLPYEMMLLDSTTVVVPDTGQGYETYMLIAIATPAKVRDGIWFFYNVHGEIIREEFYRNGTLESGYEFK